MLFGKEEAFIKLYAKHQEAEFNKLVVFINENKDLKKLQNDPSNTPFNIILAASNKYYWENFHSDIIANILEYDSSKFLPEFIEYVNLVYQNQKNEKLEIDTNNYKDPYVIREENRIDILIKDEESKHCIIIENKINNAKDMSHQLSRYVKKQEEAGFEVDAVVYLSIDGEKSPELDKKDEWIKKEKLLLCAAANDEHSSNKKTALTDDFLKKIRPTCCNDSKNVQIFSFINQYIDLLNYVRGSQMKYEEMEKFYKMVIEKKYYQTVLNIKNRANEFPQFRCERLYRIFKDDHKPFDSIEAKKNKTKGDKNIYTIFYGLKDLRDNCIDLAITTDDEENTLLEFRGLNCKKTDDYILEILKFLEMDSEFIFDSKNLYIKYFQFPSEEKLLEDFIRKLLKKLEDNMTELKKI